MTTSRSTTPVLTAGFLNSAANVFSTLAAAATSLVADDDRGLAAKLAEFRQAGTFRRAAQEGVLDDVAAGADARKTVPQFGELADLQAGIIGHEKERRSVQFRLQIVNDGGFFGTHGFEIARG